MSEELYNYFLNKLNEIPDSNKKEKRKINIKINNKKENIKLFDGTQESINKIQIENEVNVKENKRINKISKDNINIINKDIEILFEESETNIENKSKWIEYYNKALNSKKNNWMIKKFLNGRFTIDNFGKVEFLSDLNTKNKSVKELLNQKWDI